jgi:hypothetical protein
MVERLEKSKGGRRRFLHPLKQVVSCAAISMKEDKHAV